MHRSTGGAASWIRNVCVSSKVNSDFWEGICSLRSCFRPLTETHWCVVLFVLSTLVRIIDSIGGWRKKIHHLKPRMARCTFVLGSHILHVGQLLLVITNDLVLLYEHQVPSESCVTWFARLCEGRQLQHVAFQGVLLQPRDRQLPKGNKRLSDYWVKHCTRYIEKVLWFSRGWNIITTGSARSPQHPLTCHKD